MKEQPDVFDFYDSLRDDFDTTAPLCWSFTLEGAAEDQVDSIISMLTVLGFTEFEPMTDEDHEGGYVIGCSQIATHSVSSFAALVESVEQLVEQEGLALLDYTAGAAED